MSHPINVRRAGTPRLPLALLLLLFSCAHAAQAAPQTFVSAKGDDANACEQDKPCRTFAGALLKTDVGGEVAVLDSGEYGPFHVTRSVRVTAAGVYAGVTSLGGDAVDIASPAGSVVALRGLTITGNGAGRGISYDAPGPSRGEVDEEAGVTLHVEGCTISGFGDPGIAFSAQGSLFVKDTTVRGNGTAGIGLQPLPGARVRASIINCRLEKNLYGLIAYAALSEVNVASRDTVAAGNRDAGFVATGQGVRMQLQGCVAANQNYGISTGASARVTVEGCLLTNQKFGIAVINGSRVFLSATTIADNEVGLDNLQANPGHVYTFSNNRVFANGVNAQGKPSLIAQQF